MISGGRLRAPTIIAKSMGKLPLHLSGLCLMLETLEDISYDGCSSNAGVYEVPHVYSHILSGLLRISLTHSDACNFLMSNCYLIKIRDTVPLTRESRPPF